MELQFRAACRRDLKNMVSLLASDSLGNLREDTSSTLNALYIFAFQAIEQDADNELLVFEFTEQLVGMLQLTFIPYLTHIGSWRCLIEEVRVHENFRGAGIGEQMFGHAIKIAKDRHCKVVQLASDKQRPDAIRFYEKRPK